VTDKVLDLSSRDRGTVHKMVSDHFAPLKDQPCWNVMQGHGSFLTMEFGEPALSIREYKRTVGKPLPGEHPTIAKRTAFVKGQWHLYIYRCHWNISLADGARVTSDSPREDVEKLLALLSGQKLSKVTVSTRNGSSLFEFDLGGKLQTMPLESPEQPGEPQESWMLFTGENVLSYRGDGKYAFHPAGKPTKDWFT
jgi:hypothetical protein